MRAPVLVQPNVRGSSGYGKADRVKAPLLIIQGVNDPRVPVTEALRMYEALKARRIPVDLMLFPDEGHAAAMRANRALAFGHRLAFFERHLK